MSIKSFIRRPIGIITITVILVVIIVIAMSGNKADGLSDTAVASIGTVRQEVRLSGTVKPAKSVDLAFEKSGTIARVYAEVGASVKTGQTLVALESAQALAELNQAEADLKVQQAKLLELQRGTRSESIDIQSAKVAGASANVEDAKKNLADKMTDAYNKADEAVRSSVDQFFNNPRSSNPQLIFAVNNAQLEIDTEWQRQIIESVLLDWQKSPVEKNMSDIKLFLDKVWLALNSAATDASVSSADIASWKSDVSTAQGDVNAAISSLTAASEKLKTAESDLAVAKSQLTLDRAGTATEQITGQEAQVDKAAANRDFYRSQLSKTVIRSPIDAIVTKQDAKAGEIATANTVLVSLNSAAQYEIEANVPEADIAKIKLGNTARVTLDAYGSETVFSVTIIQIDPAETLIDGIATYKVKFQFAEADERVRSGMTATIVITSDIRENVVVLPSRAVITGTAGKAVRIKNGDTFTEMPVKTGLRGSDGTIEILEGVRAGDVVVITAQ